MGAKTCKIWIVQNTTRIGLVQFSSLLKKFNLTKKMICFVKNEGKNFSTMTKFSTMFREVGNYVDLGRSTPFEGVSFGHTFSKAYQQATIETKLLP
jgi:hypothetical protein